MAKKRILLVDDEKSLTSLLKLNLDINQIARAQPEVGKPTAGAEKVA